MDSVVYGLVANLKVAGRDAYDGVLAEAPVLNASPRIAVTQLQIAKDCNGPRTPVRSMSKRSFKAISLAAPCHLLLEVRFRGTPVVHRETCLGQLSEVAAIQFERSKSRNQSSRAVFAVVGAAEDELARGS
ncbi:hypothetical protein [Variovorax sp. J31P207]|uniref:hypothetical protein n=1 Tax=Variovorax sp. J31P207 TaxID=3053510 RepID=UPI00257570FB|nr:hypothetical protein [Variovorax sp. J31P207]MDM0071243.1 hypothetical protein [Variovorax sp. J31P207]